MQTICEEREISFFVNNGDGHENTKQHFKLFKELGINLLDLGIDIGNDKYNLIIDSHPNEIANEEFATGLTQYIKSKIVSN